MLPLQNYKNSAYKHVSLTSHACLFRLYYKSTFFSRDFAKAQVTLKSTCKFVLELQFSTNQLILSQNFENTYIVIISACEIFGGTLKLQSVRFEFLKIKRAHVLGRTKSMPLSHTFTYHMRIMCDLRLVSNNFTHLLTT